MNNPALGVLPCPGCTTSSLYHPIPPCTTLHYPAHVHPPPAPRLHQRHHLLLLVRYRGPGEDNSDEARPWARVFCAILAKSDKSDKSAIFRHCSSRSVTGKPQALKGQNGQRLDRRRVTGPYTKERRTMLRKPHPGPENLLPRRYSSSRDPQFCPIPTSYSARFRTPLIPIPG